MPPRFTSSADLETMIERVTPHVLALLADGMPRDEAAIVAALEGRHSKQDIRLTLMRLDVLGAGSTCRVVAIPCRRLRTAEPCGGSRRNRPRRLMASTP
jgi:hypothetical protein